MRPAQAAVFESLCLPLQELILSPDGTHFHHVRSCPVLFELEDVNKGFESLVYFEGPHGEHMMMGLCESK